MKLNASDVPPAASRVSLEKVLMPLVKPLLRAKPWQSQRLHLQALHDGSLFLLPDGSRQSRSQQPHRHPSQNREIQLLRLVTSLISKSMSSTIIAPASPWMYH